MSLRKKLIHLSRPQANKLLGKNAESLLRQGGQLAIDPAKDLLLSEHLFRLRLPQATVTLVEDPHAALHLRALCTCGVESCEHLGAFLAFVLEEKQSLGLAPEPSTPPHLSEEELEQWQLRLRKERAGTEPLQLETTSKKLWSDYLVFNKASGRTYRVALRGWNPGENYCTCPDFRKNTLGVCKHILFTVDQVRERFTRWKSAPPYAPDQVLVHLIYGKEMKLCVRLPKDCSPFVQRTLSPFAKKDLLPLLALRQAIDQCRAKGEKVLVYPDAQDYLDLHAHRLAMEDLVTAIRRDPAQHPLRRELLRVELLPYQLEGIAFVAGQGRAVLADDMGLGKTIQGVGTAELLAKVHGIQRVLVVTPASVKGQWSNEIRKFSLRTTCIVEGESQQRQDAYAGNAFFTLCNYEQVLRDLRFIENVRWDLIILDEGQRIKNWEARTTRAIKALRSRFALVLSGTPLENRLEELHSVIEFIDDRRLGPDYLFKHHHVISEGPTRKVGYRNLEILRERLRPVLLRRTRAMVLGELPPRTTQIERVVPTDEQLEIHTSAARVIAQLVRKPVLTEKDLLRLQKAMLQCRMVADSTQLVDKKIPGYSSKLDHLAELLPRLAAEEGRKVIVFSEWTGMLDLIEDRILAPAGSAWVRLDGSVQQKKRQALVTRFQEDPACTFFLATNAGSTGLNLQAANTVVNVDLPWNPAILEQRIGRAHRMGQKRPVHVILLVTTGTLEEGMLDTLETKSELSKAAIDFTSDVSAVRLKRGSDDLKARLERILPQAEAPRDESMAAQVKAHANLELNPEQACLHAQAAGQLFASMTTLLAQSLAPSAPLDPTLQTQMHQSLLAGAERHEDGSLALRIQLPNEQALQSLASNFAALMQAANFGVPK